MTNGNSDVDTLVSAFNKTYGKDLAWKKSKKYTPKRLSTGCFGFDVALGGGIPEGRITILYGSESSMKTTLSLKCIASAQKKYPEKKCVFIDVEGHFNGQWAETLGVDLDSLVYILPENAEQVVDMVESLLHADDLSVLVIDSLAAMVTQYELDESAEKAIVGKTAITINKLYRKCTNALGARIRRGNPPTIICINQVRSNIGVMYGDPDVMPGGKSFVFGAYLIVKLYGKDEMVNEISKDAPAFKTISATIRKNKVSILQKSCKFSIALLPNEKLGLSIGQSDNWAPVFHYLKYMDLFRKGEVKGWELVHPHTGELIPYKTQIELKTQYLEDKDFATSLESGVVEYLSCSGAGYEGKN